MVVLLSALGIVTLVLTAFGSDRSAPVATRSSPATQPLPTGRPTPEVVATVSNLRIRLPIAQTAVTEIGFHGSRTGALELTPLGRQENEGLLARLWRRIAGSEKPGRSWYQLGGPGTDVLDVGAAAGTDVYAPVDGTVTAISDYVLDDRPHGARIDIRPTESPSVLLSLTHVDPEPTLVVGTPVVAAASKLGTVADIAAVERQSLSRYADGDGNNVAIDVHAAPSSLP